MNSRIPADVLPIEVAPRALRFAGFEFDLVRSELKGPDGLPIALRPKAELLLRQFISRPGRLFSREELMDVLWPAAVVTDDSLVQCVGELRAALADRQQTLIRTVPRRGYRFEPVPEKVPVSGADGDASDTSPAVAAAADAEPMQGPSTATSGRAPSSSLIRRAAVGAALVVGALAAISALQWRTTPPPVRIDDELSARHVFAVMPLTVTGDAPNLRDTAELAADAIAAQISSRPGWRALAPRATRPFASASLPTLARELKATYVVTGRVAPATAEGRAAAVDLQVVSVADGVVIGAKRLELVPRFDNDAAADFGQQAMNFVRGQANQVEVAAATRPGHTPSAADLTHLGWDDIYRGSGPETTLRARARFEQALAADPTSVIALNGVGAVYIQQRNQQMPLGDAERAAGEGAIERAVQQAPNDATASMNWGILQLLRGRPELALPAFEKSNRLVPGFANGHFLRGRALLAVGRNDEVQAEVERAARLASMMGDPVRAAAAWTLGAEAALMRGDDASALSLARRGVAEYPKGKDGRAVLAASEALTGHETEAAAEMAAYRKLAPGATVARYDALRPSTNPTYLAQRARLYDGLRRAGLPER